MEAQWTIYTGAEGFRRREDIFRVRMAPSVTKVRNFSFSGCPNLQEVDLGNVTRIGKFAFLECRSLTNLHLPPTVIEIGNNAFYNCSGLERVDLGNVTKIGWCSFYNCQSLVNLRLPPTVIEIGDNAFSNCIGLERVDLSNVSKIGCEAFYSCQSLVNLRLPPTVIEIGELVFSTCIGLKRVDLSNVSKIGCEAFSLCAALEILTVPPTLMAIGERAFMGCRSLRAVLFGQGVVPSTLKDIGKLAFLGCKSLRAVHFCEGVHHVGKGAFNECNSLGGIEIPPNAFVIEWGDEPSCALAEATLIPSADGGVERTVVSGNFGQSKRFLAEVEEKISEILGQQARTQEEKLRLIGNMIINFKMVDATTCLELALLKATMDNDRNLTATPITRKRRRETRESSRVVCGAEIIIPNVLLFLDGS